MELVQALRDSDYQLSKSDAVSIVKLFFDGMAEALANGDRVEIRGFCSLFVKEYEGYTGRNPKTGKKILLRLDRQSGKSRQHDGSKQTDHGDVPDAPKPADGNLYRSIRQRRFF